MNKILLVELILIFNLSVLQAQEKKQIIDTTIYTESSYKKICMFDILWNDYMASPINRKEKIDCYSRYAKLFLQSIYGQITAPIIYVGYYLSRKKITHKLENFYKLNNLSNIENIGKDIVNGIVLKEDLKKYLGYFYYNLWLYGDTDDPIISGGVPNDYKPNLPVFQRRWFYSGVRNARWNATYINNYSNDIVMIQTSYDTRKGVVTSNYGTGDTQLGVWLRWYVDNKGRWWFFYENTKITKHNKGKLFYFGAVGLSQYKDGKVSPNNKNMQRIRKKCRFEFSLNREVFIKE